MSGLKSHIIQAMSAVPVYLYILDVGLFGLCSSMLCDDETGAERTVTHMDYPSLLERKPEGKNKVKKGQI